MYAPDGPPDGRAALCALQPALNGIDRENGDPHGNTRGTARHHDGRQRELPGFTRHGILWCELPLHDFVRSEVTRGAWPVTGKRHGRPTEHGAHAAFLVQLTHDVDAARVFGLLAGGELLLALDLKQDFDALEGSGDERHGDSAEEAGGRDLGDGEGVVFDGGEGGYELLADIIAPEGDGDWNRTVHVSRRKVYFSRGDRWKQERNKLTHGRHTHQRSRHAGVQATSQALTSNGLADDVHGAAVHTLLGRLQTDLYKIKGVADDDGADAAHAAGHKGA